jgi:hypothetical protein
MNPQVYTLSEELPAEPWAWKFATGAQVRTRPDNLHMLLHVLFVEAARYQVLDEFVDL